MKTKTKLFNYAMASTLIFGSAAAGYAVLNNNHGKTSDVVQQTKNTSTLKTDNGYKIKDMKSDKNINAAIVVLSDGKDHLLTWGNNYYEALGYETTNGQSSAFPREVILPVQGEMQQIVLGQNNSDNSESMGVVIKNSKTGLNELWMWGSDAYGKLGVENTFEDVTENMVTTPHKVLGDSKTNVQKVVQSDNTTVVLYKDQNNITKLGAFGSNVYGEMESAKSPFDNDQHYQMQDLKFATLDGTTSDKKINDVWAGVNTFYVEATDKNNITKLYSWGYNGSNTLIGNGDNLTDAYPWFAPVGELENNDRILDISSSSVGVTALVENQITHINSIYSWGQSKNGSIGEKNVNTDQEIITTPKLTFIEKSDIGSSEHIYSIGQDATVVEYHNSLTDKNELLFSGNAYGIKSNGFASFSLPEELSSKDSRIVFGESGTNIDPYAINADDQFLKFDSSKKEFEFIGNIVNDGMQVDLNISANVDLGKNKSELFFSKPIVENNEWNNKLSSVYVSSEKLGLDHQSINVDKNTTVDGVQVKPDEIYDDFVVETHFEDSSYTLTNTMTNNKVVPNVIPASKNNTPIIIASILIPFVAIASSFIIYEKKKIETLLAEYKVGIKAVTNKTDKRATIVLNKKAKYLADKDIIKFFNDEIELKSKISINENENIVVKFTGLSEFTKYSNIKMKYIKTDGKEGEKTIGGIFRTELSNIEENSLTIEEK